MQKIYTLIFIIFTHISLVVGQRVVVDAGHGWKGALSSGGCASGDNRLAIEHNTAHSVSIKTKNLIESTCNNWNVLLTRPNNNCNSWVTLSQRSTMANNWGADVFLSIHTNGGGGTGTESFYCNLSPSSNSAAQNFCRKVQSNMSSYGNWTDRRAVEDASFLGFHLSVLRYTHSVATLNEIGYGDNTNDYIKLNSDSWRNEFAKSYLKSFEHFFGTSCNTTPVTPSDSGSCIDPITISCGQTINGNTSFGYNNINTYNTCGSQPEYGRELFYKFTIANASNISASISNASIDLDIHLLSDCSNPSGSCIARNDNSISHNNLPAGTYFIAIDGYGTNSNAAGSFQLSLNCTPVSSPSSGTCSNPINLTCGQVTNGNTANGANAFNTYWSCGSQNEFGKELVYQFTVSNNSNISASLSNMSTDLDIHLSSSCNTSGCIARDDSRIDYSNLPVGTYYIIVDGYGTNTSKVGTFTLSLSCTPIINNPNPGTCSDPIPLNCGDVINGNTADGDSRMDRYTSCGNQAEFGKELVYEITLTQSSDIEATLSNMTADMDIQLLSSCNTSSCISRDDNRIIYNNLPAGTYYIVVDGYGTSTGKTGAFTLSYSCTPATPILGSCESPIQLSCGIPYTNSTVNGLKLFNVYDCNLTKPEYGKELVHEFTIVQDQDVILQLSGLNADLDIHLLSSCDATDCIARNDYRVEVMNLPAGTYYAVVDGYGSSGNTQGNYKLTLTCSPATVGPQFDVVSIDNTQGESVGIEEYHNDSKSISDIRVFPNPTKGDFQIKLNSKMNIDFEIDIINSLGQFIHSEKRNAFIGEQTLSFQNSELNLETGMYWIALKMNGQIYTEKLIFKK